ncbi:hypothetical protein PR048_007820 [Dryococelus australis]|uniref:Uncharacterized protein n=1 Tax=Dryococelus australis TaxID=614101 RepID=A0ABQ9HVC3_9NEOP|nr:hypothetical protein PR048_007820 [Dryococelus australis]
MSDEIDEAIEEDTDELVVVLRDEVGDLVYKQKKVWVREWIGHRKDYGASETLIRELAEEDPKAFRKP